MDDSPGIRCVIYAAKSTEDRKGSIPDQLRECRDALDGHADRRVVAQYVDEAFSAFKRNRGPGLIDAMQHVEDLAEAHGVAELWASTQTGSLTATAARPATPLRLRSGTHRLYTEWEDSEILGALQAWADAHGHAPRARDWARGGSYYPTSVTVRWHFNGWHSGLIRAGLEPTTAQTRYRWDAGTLGRR